MEFLMFQEEEKILHGYGKVASFAPRVCNGKTLLLVFVCNNEFFYFTFFVPGRASGMDTDLHRLCEKKSPSSQTPSPRLSLST